MPRILASILPVTILVVTLAAVPAAAATRAGEPPVALPDAYAATSGQTLTVPAGNGLLVNDVDPEDDPITVIAYALPTHGDLTVSTSGHFAYTPDGDYTGIDTFEYRISDGTSSSEMVTVTLTVLPPVQRAPIATDDRYATPAGEVLTVSAAHGLLQNDVDLDGDALSLISYQQADHGTINAASDGSFTYTPDPGYQGTESVTATITDGQAIDTSLLIIDVIASRNRAPVGQTDWYYTPAGEVLDVAATLGLLRNDHDPDGDALTVISYQQADHGIIDAASDGSFTYTPDAGYEGVEVSVYTMRDEHGAINVEPTELRILVGVYGDLPVGVLTPPSPDGFALHAPAPNPFNPRTELAFRTTAAGHVTLRILDLRGRVITTLMDDQRPAGDHTVNWNGTDQAGARAASGTYVAELRQGRQRAAQRLMLLK